MTTITEITPTEAADRLAIRQLVDAYSGGRAWHQGLAGQLRLRVRAARASVLPVRG
jgi:hypothetical protein